MKITKTLIAGLAFCLLITTGGNAFAENYFAGLEADLEDGELVVKSEDPTNNPDLFEVIFGLLREKYGLEIEYDYQNKDYNHLTFVKKGNCGNVQHEMKDSQGNVISSWSSWECERLGEKAVTVRYTGVDQTKKQLVMDSMAGIISSRHWGEELDKVVRYNVYDLSFVNYVTAGYWSWSGTEMDQFERTRIDNRMASFSPEFREDLANKNIQVYIDNRAGDGDAFYASTVGYAAIVSDGYIYGAVSSAGATTWRLIFIPEDTPDTHEAYIAAVQKRIDDYYKGTEYEGKITIELGQEYDINDDYGYPNLDNEWVPIDASYLLKYGATVVDFVIEKNDSMLIEPTFATSDVSTDISVTSDDSSIPLDTVIVVNKINNKDRSDIINKLGLTDADIYDINLHSNAADRDITKLPNGKFLVRVPIDSKYEGKKLAVYYIDVNGKVDVHEVTVKDGYAEFETNHFSEYILGAASTISNPGTLDIIRNVLVLAAGCGIIVLSSLKLTAKRR